MPNRKNGSALGYRYGFNGKEKDDEISGNGNSYDFGERLQDPRLSKFLSLDRFSDVQTGWSPYSQSGNNPVFYIDVDGNYFTGNTEFVKKLKATLSTINTEEAIVFLAEIQKMEDSEVEFNVAKNETRYMGQGNHGLTDFDIENNRVVLNFNDYGSSGGTDALENFAHEAKHGSQFLKGEIDFKTQSSNDKFAEAGGFYDYYDEKDAFKVQKIIHDYLSFDVTSESHFNTNLEQQYAGRSKEQRTITGQIIEQYKLIDNVGKERKYYSVYNYKPTEAQKAHFSTLKNTKIGSKPIEGKGKGKSKPKPQPSVGGGGKKPGTPDGTIIK